MNIDENRVFLDYIHKALVAEGEKQIESVMAGIRKDLHRRLAEITVTSFEHLLSWENNGQQLVITVRLKDPKP